MSLTYQQLREANTARLPAFKNSKYEPVHLFSDGSDWSYSEWIQALVGEIGEYANFAKKYRRGDMCIDEFREEAKKELADVLTYLDILMHSAGADPFTCEVTERGHAVYLGHDASYVLCHLTHSVSVVWGLLSRREELLPIVWQRIRYAVEQIAKIWGIDLEEATREKFNEVSNRIGCDITI